MKVYVVSQGEQCEGGCTLAIFATKNNAVDYVKAKLFVMKCDQPYLFDEKGVEEHPDDIWHYGGEWIAIEEKEVIEP